MSMIRTLPLLGTVLLAMLPRTGAAADCPGNPAALGTERALAIDPALAKPAGRKQFPQTLPLRPKEIVLTFDDGPSPSTTGRVLDALKSECVHATFFMLGRNAAADPTLAKRVLADGHTVAHHTYENPLLKRMPLDRAEAEIDPVLPRSSPPSMASRAGRRGRRSSAFPALPRAPHCSNSSKVAASQCSAPTSGPTTSSE
jgi:hypothetical protein